MLRCPQCQSLEIEWIRLEEPTYGAFSRYVCNECVTLFVDKTLYRKKPSLVYEDPDDIEGIELIYHDVLDLQEP